MIVDPKKHKSILELEFDSMPYKPVMLQLPTMPEVIPSYRCEKCGREFDYKQTLDVHSEEDHLTKNTKMEFFSTFKYFGHKKGKGPKIIKDKIREVIVDNNKLKTVFINANSIVSPYKRSVTKLGIEESKAHVVIIAESKLGKNHTEFKVRGYHTAANLIRKSNAGGLVVMAKDTIQLHSVTMKNILPEIQFVSFKFGDITFLTVYRSPSYGVTPKKVHHQKLIEHLDKEIDDLQGAKYVITGDFNLSTLARNDFEPTGSQDPLIEEVQVNNGPNPDPIENTQQPNTKTHAETRPHKKKTRAPSGRGDKSRSRDKNRNKNKNKNNGTERSNGLKMQPKGEPLEEASTKNSPTNEEEMSTDYLWADFVNRRTLEQWVDEPTFHRYNSVSQTTTETMTDLLFSPPSVPIHKINVEKDLFQGRFDHYAVVFIIDLNFKTNETPRVRRVQKADNWKEFNRLMLSYDLYNTCPRSSVDAMADHITKKIMEAYNTACPLVEVKPPPPGGPLPQGNKELHKKGH